MELNGRVNVKNLKSIEEHKQFYGAIREGKAKVVTYALTNTNYPRFAKDHLHPGSVLANFDSDPKKWGSTLEIGAMTMPLDELPAMSKKADGIVVMSESPLEIGKYLDGLGLSYYFNLIFSEGLLESRMSGEEPSVLKVEIEENQGKINKVRSLLADSLSRFVYDTALEARYTYNLGERYKLILKIFTDDQYFPERIPSFLPSKHEVFIDGGAYDGDTARKFIKNCGGEYEQIYSFEPEPTNFTKLERLASDYQNFTCYKKGLYSTETVLEFSSYTPNLGSSTLKNLRRGYMLEEDCKSVKTEVCAIDNIIHTPVTFIKMDIEGSELEALKGASLTITQYKPKLAICIYHKIEDFWEIPLYINSLVPEYKFYICHHDPFFGLNETVLYAIA
jgi:FkbM family methyltransferase